MLRLSSCVKRPCLLGAKFVRPLSNSVRYNLKPFEKLASHYPNVGMLKIDDKQLGSCVLVNDQTALTLSHCIPSMWWQRRFETYFSPDAGTQIKDVLTHPLYKDKFSKVSTVVNDLAVILLKDKVGVKKAEIDYKEIFAEDDCVAVGFPGSFSPTPADPSDSKCPRLQQSVLGKKLAVKNSCYSDPYFKTVINGTIESKIGYVLNPKTGKFVKKRHQLYGASTSPGMSGGGLFKNGRLIGLNQGGFSRIAHGPWTNNFFVSLARNQFWLENVLNSKYASSTEVQNQNDISLLEKFESLMKTKIDPECHSAEYSPSENCIKIKISDAERVNCAKLLFENGFAPAYNEKSLTLLPSPTLILMNETLNTAIEKLSLMPDRVIDIEREVALAKDYSFS